MEEGNSRCWYAGTLVVVCLDECDLNAVSLELKRVTQQISACFQRNNCDWGSKINWSDWEHCEREINPDS